jgi:hypothetical protein
MINQSKKVLNTNITKLVIKHINMVFQQILKKILLKKD